MRHPPIFYCFSACCRGGVCPPGKKTRTKGIQWELRSIKVGRISPDKESAGTTVVAMSAFLKLLFCAKFPRIFVNNTKITIFVQRDSYTMYCPVLKSEVALKKSANNLAVSDFCINTHTHTHTHTHRTPLYRITRYLPQCTIYYCHTPVRA